MTTCDKLCPICGKQCKEVYGIYECDCGWFISRFNNGVSKNGFPIPLE
jgi:hypothetical protein